MNNFIRGIDPRNAMKIGASQTLIPQMLQKFVDLDPQIYEVFVFECFLCIYTKKNPFLFFRIGRLFRKAGIKKYIRGLYRWTFPQYRSSFLLYYLINEKDYHLFKITPKEGDRQPRFEKTKNEL